jgi:hypothetical protein
MNSSGQIDQDASERRSAKVAKTESGPIGVCIFLTAHELRELDVDPAQADEIEYRPVQVDNRPTLRIMESSRPSPTSDRESITD